MPLNPIAGSEYRLTPGRAILGAGGSDAELVCRARLGERGAFDALVRKYQRRVLDLAWRHTRNRSDAEDTAQEAFICAYRGLRKFRGECAFYTWLHRIVINCARNVLRARCRDSAISGTVPRVGETCAAATASSWELETPEDLTITTDIRRALVAAIEAMPQALRTAITCREIDSMTYEQIAITTGCPIGTVRSRVFRAREMIDRKLRLVCDGGLGRGGRQRCAASDENERFLMSR